MEWIKITGMKKIKVEIEIPDEFEPYFIYLSSNFFISKKKYIENLVKKEVNSRNDDLNLF